jgi:hypothetical protein
VLSSIRLSKQRQGLIYDEFEALMFQYGYCDDPKLKGLLKAVFSSSAGFVADKIQKSAFNGKFLTQFSKKVPVLSMLNLKALLYSIRNLYDFEVLQDKTVNPSLLSSKSARYSQLSSEM